MENPAGPGRIQMERFIPVNEFEVFHFSGFFETTEIFCTFFLDY